MREGDIMERKGTGKLREINDHKVIDYFIKYKVGTKKEIAENTSLSVMTIGTILNDFLQEKIIRENEMIYPQKGRPTMQFQLNPNYYHLLLILVNKESFTYVIKDALNQIIKSETEKRIVDGDYLVTLVEKNLKEDSYIHKVGIGLPAVVSNNQIIESDIAQLKEYPLVKKLQEKKKIEVLLYNDMKCSAYGYYQQMVKQENISFVVFSKDIVPGVGSVIDGKILNGKNGIAGEVIYLPMFQYLKNKEFTSNFEYVIQVLATLISVLNPHVLVLTGDYIDNIEKIKEDLKEYIPQTFIPQIVYLKNYEEYYLNGLQQILIETMI